MKEKETKKIEIKAKFLADFSTKLDFAMPFQNGGGLKNATVNQSRLFITCISPLLQGAQSSSLASQLQAERLKFNQGQSVSITRVETLICLSPSQKHQSGHLSVHSGTPCARFYPD